MYYFPVVFKYRRADWVKQHGFPEHHLRIIRTHVNPDGERWYLIFDTTLQRSFAEYDWKRADELEAGSELVKSADNDGHALAILALCAQLRFMPYSIPQRLDCESLQRYIHSAREEDRWSPQVMTTVATVAIITLLVAASKGNQRSGSW